MSSKPTDTTSTESQAPPLAGSVANPRRIRVTDPSMLQGPTKA